MYHVKGEVKFKDVVKTIKLKFSKWDQNCNQEKNINGPIQKYKYSVCNKYGTDDLYFLIIMLVLWRISLSLGL